MYKMLVCNNNLLIITLNIIIICIYYKEVHIFISYSIDSLSVFMMVNNTIYSDDKPLLMHM